MKREFGHEAKTVPEMGWGRKRNGELLALAAAEFDVFLTGQVAAHYVGSTFAFDAPLDVLQLVP